MSAAVPAGEQALLEELRGARESGRRVPEFFVVGHAKSGTTALHAMLEPHPELFLPVLRETQFLARGPGQRAEPSGEARRRPRTLEAYLALFAEAAPGQRAGEISTAYLRTPEAAERIAALRPDARIIAFFREPASFVRSLHLQLLQVGFETERDLSRALALEAQRSVGRSLPAGEWPESLLYMRHTRYTEQLRSYRERFGAERVLWLLYEDFREDNEKIVREVLRFLGVDRSVEIPQSEANPTVRVRSRRAERVVHALSTGRSPLARTLGSTVKAVTPASLRRGALRTVRGAIVDRAPAEEDERVMAELRSGLRAEVESFAAYTGREDLLARWGYAAD